MRIATLLTGLFAAAIFVTNTATAQAQPAGDEAVAEVAASPSPSGLIQLNRGISAYLNDDDIGAEEILTDLAAREPQNIACQYYLGLVHLRQGLRLSKTAVDDEGTQQARNRFQEAQNSFQRVMDLTADHSLRGLRVDEAALNLSIAQLAGEDMSRDEEARRRAETAASQLDEYVGTPQGRDDRFGHFFRGVAYYRLGDIARDNGDRGRMNESLRRARSSLNEAVRAARDSQRRGDISPEDAAAFEVNVVYYQGLISTVWKKLYDARSRFATVARDAPPELDTLVKNAESIIEEIDKKLAAAPEPITLAGVEVSGYVEIGNWYDSNVILLGRDTELPRGITRKGDYKFGLSSGFDLRRRLTPDEGVLGESLTVGVGGSTFNAWQPSVDEFDINQYSGRAYVNWEALPDFYMGLQYDYTYTKLGRQPFISSNRLVPVVSYVWRDPDDTDTPERARTDLYYIYDYRNYFDKINDQRFDRDGQYHAVGITQSFNLWRARDIWNDYYTPKGDSDAVDFTDGERWLQTRIGYVYRNERTQGSEFDLWGNTVFWGFDLPLPLRLTLDFTSEFTWDNYTEPSTIDYRRNHREDTIQRFDIGLTRILVSKGQSRIMPSLQIRMRAGAEVTIQDSNIWNRYGEDVYEYDRGVYGLRLMIDF